VMAGHQMQLVLIVVLGVAVRSQNSVAGTSSFSQPSFHGGFKPSGFRPHLASSLKTKRKSYQLKPDLDAAATTSKNIKVKVVKVPSTSSLTIPAIDNEISYFEPLESSASEEIQIVRAIENSGQSKVRVPRQGGSVPTSVPGGVDFSQATRTADGRLCVIKEESIETLSKDPILECTHKNVEKCHYTYLTYFKPTQEEACEENFEKKCQIVFKQEAIPETIRKCYRPLEKVCNGQGPEECRTVYESSCSTKYIEKSPGKFVGDTKCEKLPVEICGQGCVTEEGPEECHNKQVDTLVDVPEETCDLSPQKTCRLVTKLVPSLKPKQECTTVPQETCSLKFSQPKLQKKPLRTEWCLDEEADSQPDYSSNARTGRIFG